MDDHASRDDAERARRVPAEHGCPFVSVIVPFFGTSTVMLDRCVDALLAQEYPGDKLEVIIVDNNVDPFLIDHYRSGVVSLRVIHEPRPGSYCARNRGISVARGEVYAFTDSDCVPAVDWIQSGIRLLQATPNCGLVAGSVILTFRNRNVPGLFETYDLCMNLRQEEYVREFHFGATANLMAYSAVFDKVGRFNETLLSGGDREWGRRVWKMGYQQVFAGAAVVYHSARHTVAAVCTKARRLAGQDFMMISHKGPIYFLLLEIRGAAIHIQLVWKKRREVGILRALQVMSVIGYVQAAKYFELLRLLRGGTPRR